MSESTPNEIKGIENCRITKIRVFKDLKILLMNTKLNSPNWYIVYNTEKTQKYANLTLPKSILVKSSSA